ncbi:acetylornithine transaminase [Vagococcus sp. BWB3-3]|uniref:Acetylornithine aminotransferase n=1 Tax=Vagococcus allomyrinae TaxID=2794353 RepID=A0A940PDH3_9ENTE|nr:acetylornithine transaminase [Vagococcus allomyrinae]MBP1041943.1 acetylornithine transaminase [Vagococcus allomyrinae]
MSYLLPNYQRANREFVSGAGGYLIDSEGQQYLDFSSGIGVANLGYDHPRVKAAVTGQLEKLWHTPNLYQNSLQEQVAAQLIGEKNYQAFFCNSGTEANEAALKLIRKASGKAKIITFIDSFHGRTFGSMSATGQAKIHGGFGAIVPGFVYLPYNDLEVFEAALDEAVGGVLLELIQGEGGVLPADPEWVKAVQRSCQEKGILLAVDEVQTGMGRTGTLYLSEQYELMPDIITLAKGLGNGLPVGAMLAKKELAIDFGPGTHGSTFGGNLVAMSAASAVLGQLNESDFLTCVKRKGDVLKALLEEELLPLATVVDVRGIGFMIGVEVTLPPSEVVETMAQAGVVALTAGHNVVRLLPPLTLTVEQLKTGVAVLKESLAKYE